MSWIGATLLPVALAATLAVLYLAPRNLGAFRLFMEPPSERRLARGWAKAAWLTSVLTLFLGMLAPLGVAVCAVLVVLARARGAADAPESRLLVVTAALNAAGLALIYVMVVVAMLVEGKL